MLKKYNLTQDIINNLASKVSGSNNTRSKGAYREHINEYSGSGKRSMPSMVKPNVYRKNTTDYHSNSYDNQYSSSDSRYRNHYRRYRVLAIFTGTDVGIMESIRELSLAKRYGIDFDIAFSESGSDIIDIETIKRELQPVNIYTERDKLNTDIVVEGVEAIIVPMTTQNTVAKLSLGIQDTFTSFALWQSLWHGKPVLMDYKNVIKYRGNSSQNPLLSQMMEDYVTKLGKMGVKEVKKNEYVSDLLRALNVENNEAKKEAIDNGTKEDNKEITKRTLITEKDVIELSKEGSEITIPRRTIVTPLAYDTAKELGIKIVKV